jgi:hypothetical protein
MPIQWDGMPWETYEDVVAVLLSVMNPDIRRVDGRGGDEGRDLHFSDGAGLHVYELKSFTGRMDAKRRKQVERSLNRAKDLKPTPSSWDLVVPIDPTPEELRWFESLAPTVPFPLRWNGRTWLEARMAEHPVVRRSILEGGADEAIRLLREAKEEAAALGRGVPDAVERGQKLVARLNELDAYYVFDLTVEASGSYRVGVKPRYKGADLERPITGNFTLEFPDTPAGHEARRRFADALKFGEEVELDGSYVKAFHLNAPAGLGGDFNDAASLALRPVGSADWKRQMRLRAVDPNGNVLAELPIWLNRRTHGTSGAVLSGADRTGGLQVEMRVDFADPRGGSFSVSFTMPQDAFPEDISPVFDLMAYLKSPNQLIVVDADTGLPLGTLTGFADLQVDEVFGDLIAKLARLQRETRRRFPFPAVLTTTDQEELALAEHLMNGGSLPHTWTAAQVASTPAKVLAARDVIEQNQCLTAEFDGEYTFDLAGMKISLPVRNRLHSARISNGREALRQAEGADDPDMVISLDFVPGESDSGEIFFRR